MDNVLYYIPIYKWFFGIIIDDCVVCNSSCGNFANLSLNRRYIYCIKKICPCKKKTHKYTSVAVSYRNTMPYKISGLFTHFFERIYLRLFQFALLELSTKELQLQIKKLKSIWAESFIKIYVHTYC